jgi:hypothetical protein
MNDMSIELALDALCNVWGATRGGSENPFQNTGAEYIGKCFVVRAYDWGDDHQPYNFKWRDIEVSWYKYLGRGMEASRKVAPSEVKQLLRECMHELLEAA